MILLDNVRFAYNGSPILSGLQLNVAEGELHGIIGPNGAGKSTLLRIVAGILTPQSGNVRLNKTDLIHISNMERARLLAFVFQENYTGFPYSVQQMVLLGRHPRQDSVLVDSPEDLAIAEEMLRLLDVWELRERLYRTLSGGEKQRVAIAAALAQKTPVILFDEPTAYTDIRYQSEIYRLIRDITRKNGLTSLLVTHDINLASLYCDCVSILHHGHILASGKPENVLTETLLRETYGPSVRVIRHPEAALPLVIPVRQEDGR